MLCDVLVVSELGTCLCALTNLTIPFPLPQLNLTCQDAHHPSSHGDRHGARAHTRIQGEGRRATAAMASPYGGRGGRAALPVLHLQ